MIDIFFTAFLGAVFSAIALVALLGPGLWILHLQKKAPPEGFLFWIEPAALGVIFWTAVWHFLWGFYIVGQKCLAFFA